MKFKHTFLIACLSATPLQAQQEEKIEVKTATESIAVANVDAKITVTYIGVLTREIPAELRSQFSLPDGFGVMIDDVMPDSPAKAAGLKRHDILVKFGDQQLVNMEQLMVLVRAKNKGDVVNLTILTGGKETQMPVTLGERMVAAKDRRSPHDFSGWPQGLNGEMKHFQKDLHQYQERLQDWMKGGKEQPMPQPPDFHVPGQHPRSDRREGEPQRPTLTQPHAAMNITRRDDSGEYSLKREDGRATFSVRPNHGKEQSWPVNTEEERQAVPEAFRDKLRLLEGAGSGVSPKR